MHILKESYWHLKENLITPDKADTTLSMNDDDFVGLMTGKLNPQTVCKNYSFDNFGSL